MLASSETSWFAFIIESIQAVMSILGFLGNAITYVLLLKHQVPDMTPLVRHLLRHQALVDAVICIMATIHIIQPVMFMVGLPALDLIICQCWHGQAIYWAMIFVSVYNLVLIAYERFLAICRPLQLDNFSDKKCWAVITAIYIYSFTLGQAGSYFQVRYDNGTCLPEYYFGSETFRNVMFGYAVFTFNQLYALPMIAFIVLYGNVLLVLYKRQKEDLEDPYTLGPPPKVICNASICLTKNAIIVTIVFIISFTYDLWYYLLGNTGVLAYVQNSPEQKLGVFLAVANSCANPFIFFTFMPSFRQCVLRHIWWKSRPNQTPKRTFRAKESLTNSSNKQSLRRNSDFYKPIKVTIIKGNAVTM